MDKLLYRVRVVVDRNFGEQFAAFERGVPVWMVDTPVNRAVAQRLWIEGNDEGPLTGITLFDDRDLLSPEELFTGELDTLDMHHGTASCPDSPYSIVDVYGAPLTDAVRSALSKYGFIDFRHCANAFSAMRPVPTG